MCIFGVRYGMAGLGIGGGGQSKLAEKHTRLLHFSHLDVLDFASINWWFILLETNRPIDDVEKDENCWEGDKKNGIDSWDFLKETILLHRRSDPDRIILQINQIIKDKQKCFHQNATRKLIIVDYLIH